MPEANQYTFSNKELLALLMKEAGVREGRWMLMANFGVSPGSIGPSPEQVSPGVAIFIGHIGISKAQPDTPEAVTLDAAEIAPKKKGKVD